MKDESENHAQYGVWFILPLHPFLNDAAATDLDRKNKRRPFASAC